MIGFKVIKEMSKDELIEEILEGQRQELGNKDTTELKAMVVEFRVMHTREALTKEAGIITERGPMGLLQVKDEDDE